MKKIRVYNGYAGLGGNRKKWKNVEVTAVEIDRKVAEAYKKNFPEDTVIIGDSHEYLLNHANEFGFVWISPPCPTHSKLVFSHPKIRYPDMKLWQEIIFLKHHFKGYWVAENVDTYYDPLIKPTVKIGRHLFWSNYEIYGMSNVSKLGDITQFNTVKHSQGLKEFLDIHYEGSIYLGNSKDPCQVLRNCVLPDIGLHVFEEHKRIGLFNQKDFK